MPLPQSTDPESRRLHEEAHREKNWKRWGPYLSERQWGTVREDYSADGNSWTHLPFEHAHARAYRWGEDGLLGWSDRQCRLCFSVALWNERDPILKERLYGLTNPQGNHGEDVKECYYYLDSTPTHSYAKALYKYPQAAFPYDALREENARRGYADREFEITDTGVFDEGRYFDVVAEYAKADDEDVLVRIHVTNRGPESARVHVLPTLWFRNTWIWGCRHEGCTTKPVLAREEDGSVSSTHESLGEHVLRADETGDGVDGEWLFTDNHTNNRALYDAPNPSKYAKDAFHRRVVDGDTDAVNPKGHGTKAAWWVRLEIDPGETRTLRLRLSARAQAPAEAFGAAFDEVFELRRSEADAFYDGVMCNISDREERRVARQAYAGLLWSKQFYHYIVEDWLRGDPEMPAPPPGRSDGRNAGWDHLFNKDILSMPDKWEYPWFAAWDSAFHMVPFAEVDPVFAKAQLELFLREWYMHPNGQIPAYEFNFGDVNPPVHGWACWRAYLETARNGERDRGFLERTFHKLLLNFTWWVNRKDPDGQNIFSGGFLGLDNIGVFDRSHPLPTGGTLEQADATAWMAFFCGVMLRTALELARENPAYEDIASKFFEHFVAIADAINEVAGEGLWDEEDGFYYDQIRMDHKSIPLRVRSMVGIIPLFAAQILEDDLVDRLPGFKKRTAWFQENRPDLSETISYLEPGTDDAGRSFKFLAIPSRERLERVLARVFDEKEFLSPHGIRSLSRAHGEDPLVFTDWNTGEQHAVRYVPGESDSGAFGGNSNWRGPVWFPVNYLLIDALEKYDRVFGNDLRVEFPTGSGNRVRLHVAAQHLRARLASLFLPDGDGHRPANGGDARYAGDPAWRDLVLFHEYFDGDTGRGLGASHQTGWTALAATVLCEMSRRGNHPTR